MNATIDAATDRRIGPAWPMSRPSDQLQESMQHMALAARSRTAAILAVGGASSTLVDDLMMDGFVNLTVLDVSAAALEATKRRLGRIAKYIGWRTADVLETEFRESAFDVWHDRAVFQQLSTPVQRERYLAQVLRALKPDGIAVIGGSVPCTPNSGPDPLAVHHAADEMLSTFEPLFKLIGVSMVMKCGAGNATPTCLYTVAPRAR